MTKKVSDKQIKAAQRVAAQLCGTCSSGDELIASEPALAKMDRLDADVLIEQYGEIFLCSGCGWWLESEEMFTDTGDQLCPDCSTEGGD